MVAVFLTVIFLRWFIRAERIKRATGINVVSDAVKPGGPVAGPSEDWDDNLSFEVFVDHGVVLEAAWRGVEVSRGCELAVRGVWTLMCSGRDFGEKE